MQRLLCLLFLPIFAWSQNAGQQTKRFGRPSVPLAAAPRAATPSVTTTPSGFAGDVSIALLGARYSVSGLTDVLSWACQIPINDGNVHTVGNAPSSSCFYGVTTLAGLAAVTIKDVQPFSWLTATSNNIFTSSTGAYKLTDASVPQLDIAWLCIQTSLLQGKTYIPAGTYIVGSSVPLPLSIPPGIEFAASFGGVYTSIHGDGPRVSIIKAGFDWGAGYHLMICGDPIGTKSNGLGRYSNGFPGNIEGIGLFSSASSVIFTTGTASINMDGFGWGERLRVQDIEVDGFNHDMTIVGDHTEFIRVFLNGGAIGMYLPEPSATNFGDLEFIDFHAEGQSQAAIAVSKHATLAAIFNGETYLSAPYSILGEASDGTCKDIANGLEFDRLMAEYTGNALVADDSNYSNGAYNDGQKCRNFSKVLIRDLFMSWDNSSGTGTAGMHFWGGPGQRQRRAAIDVRAMSLTVDNLECDSGCWTPASAPVPSGSMLVGTVNLSRASDYFGTNLIRGAVQNWISRSGSLPLLSGGFGPVFDSFAFENQNGTWGGIIDYAYSPNATYSTHSVGEVVQYNQGFYYTAAGTTADLQPPVGICAQSGVPINVNSTYIPIITHGGTGVNIDFQSPKYGPWKMGTGIGGMTISAAGTGGVNGTYSFSSSGGGCATQPTGTFTVANGGITSYSITNYGVGCTSAPTIYTTAATGLIGATLTPKWPAGIAVPASNWADSLVIGAGRSGSQNSGGNTIVLELRGLR
jgi:hypothetical protein